MRKRIIVPVQPDAALPEDQWLDLEALAEVEISSEDAAHPVEFALLPGQPSGWLAAGPGKQILRLIFARPQPLRRIWLRFVESHVQRAQQYSLRWSPDGGTSFSDIVRQQWNFSPQGATQEIEDHRVDLPAVTLLELSIDPDTAGGGAVASLEALRLA